MRMHHTNEESQEQKIESNRSNFQDDSSKNIYPKNKSRVSAVAVTRLFKNLCGIFRDKIDNENRRTIYTHAVDKRVRREDEAKRNAEILYE